WIRVANRKPLRNGCFRRIIGLRRFRLLQRSPSVRYSGLHGPPSRASDAGMRRDFKAGVVMRRAALLICIVLSLATGQAGGFQPEHDKAQRLLDNARELTTRLKSTADRDAVGMDQAADTAAVVSRYLKFRANMVDDPAMKD